MATPTPTHFLVVAYDSPTGDRLAHREKHLEGIAPLYAGGSGPLQFGGAIFSDDGSRMIGSSFCLKAESLAAVRAIVEGDAYYVNGVWDKERITIVPFLRAI
ncbi:hypothetical protein AURDEDRAFT_175012 [Auricularia subglabra TFB-10046 SS5]|nr:hypothetical protein AURDEDRAFT_175012 [Auricularia subglabra TFB-10046 SS5]